MKNSKFWAPVIASLAATPLCLLAGLGSAGGGHGDYVWARVLFPYTMLSALAFGTISVPFLLLAVIQFPLYGLTLGAAAKRGRLLSALLVLAAVHALSAAASFFEHGENF